MKDFSLYQIGLMNGDTVFVEAADDLDEYRMNTFLVYLQIGRIVSIKKLGRVLVTLSDESIETHAKFAEMVKEARIAPPVQQSFEPAQVI